MTKKDVDKEINKSIQFSPFPKRLIIATSANKDVNVEAYVRNKNIESTSNGGFVISLFSWEDICDMLRSYRNSYNWYVNNCQFLENSNVEISFNGHKEIAIYPKYDKIISYTVIKGENTNEDDELKDRLRKLTTKYSATTFMHR